MWDALKLFCEKPNGIALPYFHRLDTARFVLWCNTFGACVRVPVSVQDCSYFDRVSMPDKHTLER